MAINEKEITLSNKSYVNKDFASIYPEQVKFVQNITNRWDPQTSNESDPGVVLLKSNSFIGDKLNYNIDKNILETFMPSCTQETSMRMNCESRGYDMNYYMSSEVDVTFTYAGDVFDDEDSASIILPKYDTVLTTEDESVFFVLTKDVEFRKDSLVSTVKAIQGTLDYLYVSNSNKIQLDNLDDNNRIYFDVTNVAQNGIIITNDSNEEWSRTTNLNSEISGKKVYKFGYDSKKGLPYIEFSSDIASLIGEGVYIKYLTTSGKNGNVKAGSLTKISSTNATKNNSSYTLSQDEDNSEVIVKNESASKNGADPETIDEAYSNYKRTIGTFDTLVTCRDFANAIYNLTESDSSDYVVSNVQVSDRRDDINNSIRVSSLDEHGTKMINYKPENSTVTAFDLYLYPLKPINSYSLENYVDSFTPLTNINYITDELENSKCLSHDYKISDGIYLIKNKAKLDAKIVTTYKVNTYERVSIIENIQEALIENFNAREVDYGYEIPYESILNVIQNADSRISSVSLSEPELETVYVTKDGTEVSQKSYNANDISKSGVNYFTTILAKNILNGKISLFDFDKSFKYDFGQSSAKKLENLAKVTTNFNITLKNNEKSRDLVQNEVIQVIGPNLITKTSYSAYVYYCYTGVDITDNTNHQLSESESLLISYTDTEGNAKIITHSKGEIIQPSGFTLKKTEQSSGGGRVVKTVNEKDVYFSSLGAKESINIQEFNKTTLSKTYYCYWIRNNANNELFTESDYDDSGVAKIILNENEYFFYTDEGFNTLVTVGSGTTLKTNFSRDDNFFYASQIDYSTIAEKGLDAIKSYMKRIIFTKDDDSTNGTYLEMIENTILTLTKDDNITLNNLDTPIELDNTFKPLVSKVIINYTLNGSSDTLPSYSINNVQYEIRSRLDLNVSDSVSQSLTEDQTVTFYDKDYKDDEETSNNKLKLTKGDYFNLNSSVQLAGGTDLDLRIYDLVKKDYVYSYSVYKYNLTDNKVSRSSSDFAVIKFKHVSPTASAASADNSDEYIEVEEVSEKTLDIPSLANYSTILSLFWTPSSDSTSSLTITTNSGTLKFFNNTRTDDNITLTKEGLYTLALSNVSSIKIECTEGQGNLIIDHPKFYKGNLNVASSYSGYNSALGIDELKEDIGDTVSTDNIVKSLLEKLLNQGSTYFYYSQDIENSKIIETKDMSSPYALYDYNNIANKFTITQIDLDNSEIDVVRSSRK